MTRFLDGPAKAGMLMLKRSPIYLRVVRDARNMVIDALDQLSDHPESTEELFAYVLTERPALAFIDGPKISGCYPIATYKLVDPQPADPIMRDASQWAEWTDCMGPPDWFGKDPL